MPTLIYNNKIPKFFEPSGNGKNFTSFRSQPQNSDIIYDLPMADGTNGQFLTTNGNCILSWTSPISVTPLGSGTELQYRNGSNFGPITGSSWDNSLLSLPNVKITTSSSSSVPLTLQSANSQSVNVFECKNSSGDVIGKINNVGSAYFYQKDSTGFCELGLVNSSNLGTYILTAGSNSNWHPNSTNVWTQGFHLYADNGYGDGVIGFYPFISGQYDGNNPKVIFLPNGCVGIGITSPTSHLHQVVPSSTTIGHTITLAASQTANAFEINSNSGNSIFRVTKDGQFEFRTGSGNTNNKRLTFEKSSNTGNVATLTIGHTYDDDGGTYTALQCGGAGWRLAYDNSKSGLINWAWGGLFWSEGQAYRGCIVDTGIMRISAGLVEINNGTFGVYRDLKLRSLYATAGVGTDTPLILKSATSQTASIIECQNTSGQAFLKINETLDGQGGEIRIFRAATGRYCSFNFSNTDCFLDVSSYDVSGYGSLSIRTRVANVSPHILAYFHDTNGINFYLKTNIYVDSASSTGLVIKGAAAQTANLQEWQDSSGTILTKINKSGNLALGKDSSTYLNGQFSFANGKFSTAGDAQFSRILARKTTTNGTTSLLYLDGVSEHIQIPTNTTWSVTVTVLARSGEEAITQSWKCLINRGSGNATLWGDPSLVYEEKTATATTEGWTSDITVDNVGLGLHDKLFINVTGYNERTINWVANIEIIELAG